MMRALEAEQRMIGFSRVSGRDFVRSGLVGVRSDLVIGNRFINRF